MGDKGGVLQRRVQIEKVEEVLQDFEDGRIVERAYAVRQTAQLFVVMLCFHIDKNYHVGSMVDQRGLLFIWSSSHCGAK